jgi:hypothetical protein
MKQERHSSKCHYDLDRATSFKDVKIMALSRAVIDVQLG